MRSETLRTALVGLSLVAAALLATGCDETDEICGLTPTAAGARDSYPTAGQGTAECAVIADLSFTDSDGAEYSLGADVFADRSKKLLLITTTAGWCKACIEEQPVLKAFHEEWSSKGLAVMVAYFEDSLFNPATVELAAQWKETYELPFPVVADIPFVLSNYYDEQSTPMNMLVDVETMTMLSISTGTDSAPIRALIETWL